MTAIENKNYEGIEILLNEKDDINNYIVDVNRKSDESSPLISSVQHEDIRIVKLLLKRDDLDVNQTTNNNIPLFIAIQKENYDIIKLLLQDERLNINKKDFFSQTALHFAVMSGKVDIVEMLLDKENIVADIKGNHETAFSIALKYEKTEIAIILLKSRKIDMENVIVPCSKFF